jgi:predicted transcriptional regulator
MPINGQCGFIFLNNVSAEGVARVAAHELGHGAFRLYHTFSSDNRYVLPEGTTDNLMDYNGATALYKYQWDYIHDPQTMLFAWADEEEEGAMGILCFNQLESIVEKIRKANIDKKAEIELQLFSCYEDYQYNKVKFGKKEFSGVKISIKGYSRAFLEKDNNNDQIPSYNIKPSELCKQSYSDNGIKFVKYLFHELKYDIKNVPYDKKEPTGEVRIEISIKENEAKDFEDYL